MIEMELVGVKTESLGNHVLLLKETGGNKHLPIWIAQPEANAISLGQEGIITTRPLTHQLILNILAQLNAEIVAIHITHFDDGIFYSDLILANDVVVSARPSDAIALAVRSDIPIFAREELLQEVGVVFDDLMDDEAQNQLEQFKSFLDDISPEDFKTTDDK